MKKVKLSSLAAIVSVALMISCSAADWDGYYDPSGRPSTPDSGSGESGGGSGQGNTSAGVVTAGEWNDLDNWSFWSGLMNEQTYGSMSDYWRYYTNNRIAVKVDDGQGNAVCGVEVAVLRATEQADKQVLWKTVTDNLGRAELWVGLNKKELAEPTALTISIDGVEQPDAPQITSWTSEQTVINNYSATHSTAPEKVAQVAFIVDATGSMMDEINFLKDDLNDIIGRVEAEQSAIAIHTAALFYRDKDDDYVTRFSQFNSQLSVTSDFIGQQTAAGGGDYPEAVHTALYTAIQALSWEADSYAKIAFLILDAPPHKEDDVIDSIHSSVELFAASGIKIIPIAASGVDKNTEFLLRDMAIATNGTYVFITNDSGVGGEHIKASVGDYKVEQLNNLMIRLIKKYIE